MKKKPRDYEWNAHLLTCMEKEAKVKRGEMMARLSEKDGAYRQALRRSYGLGDVPVHDEAGR